MEKDPNPKVSWRNSFYFPGFTVTTTVVPEW